MAAKIAGRAKTDCYYSFLDLNIPIGFLVLTPPLQIFSAGSGESLETGTKARLNKYS